MGIETFLIIFVFVFFLVAISGGGHSNKNDKEPRLTVSASVVSKRAKGSHQHSADTKRNNASCTYFVTFQVASGDHMELQVTENEYGLLMKGDRGELNFQGKKLLRFERK